MTKTREVLKLQTEEKELNQFFSQTSSPLALLIGPEHTFVLANRPYFELIGQNPIGKTVRETFTFEEAGNFFTLLDQVYRNGIPYVGNELSFKRLLPNGHYEELKINVIYHPYRNPEGSTVGILAFAYDVTEQILARKKAETNESRLRSIFAHASVGFAVSTFDDHFIEVNPRFSEITGYTIHELQKLTTHDLVHPEDRPRELEKIKELLAGKVSSFVIEKRFIKKNGSIVWVRNSVSLIPGDNNEHLIIRVAEDVTAFRETDQLRKESEERYIRLAESMPQIVWTAKPNGDINYFNQSWFEYSGSNFDENVDSKWIQFVHPDDVAKTISRWSNALETDQIYENEFRLRAKDGTYRWHVSRAIPSRSQDGKISVWHGTNTDIHNRKVLTEELVAAKKEIESEQQKFKTIFSDSTTAMAVLRGKDLVFEIANPSYFALIPNRDIIGKPFLEALPELKNQKFPNHAKMVFETGVPYRENEAKAYLRKSGTDLLEERYFDQIYTRMLDKEGNPYGVFIHAIEVTDRVKATRELKETSERFRNAVEAANMGTWELNPQTNEIIWSERTNELFGVSRTSKLPLETALQRVHKDDRDRVTEAIHAALDPQGNGEYKIEYRIQHEDGNTRWVSLLGQSFFDDSPNGRRTTKFSGTVLDVTDRILAEAALRDAKERAENANATKSAFLANMSHEIRTPLGAIMGFVSLIKDEGITREMLTEYVSVIERNSTQLMRIVDDILDLSKVEAGMMLIEHIHFSLIELLSDFSSLMGFRAREKGIVFELKAKTELPNIIKSDPTRIRQILTNIVGNAIKFTERGSVQLHVSFENHKIHFLVQDTGRGISPEQATRLFEPFSQADISTTRKYGGTGLGLALTRRLSEALGGQFDLISSSLGKGSVFQATIQVELPQTSQMVKALGFATPIIRDAGVHPRLLNMKILLVEDSLDNQALFSIFLSRVGAKIDIASDGSQGCEMALGGDYDVVLMDVQMPIMDGITAVKKLRSLGYQVPIIALTAHAMKDERARCLDAGYTEFLSKPAQRNDLIEMLTKFYK